MRDNRWNIIALLLLRISQLALGVIVLAIAAFFTSRAISDWVLSFVLALGVLTLFWAAIVLGLFFTDSLSPHLAVIVDVLLAICYIVSVAAVANKHSEALHSSCSITIPSYPSEFVNSDCSTLKAGFGFLVIEMLMFHGAIIWDTVVVYRNPIGRPRGVQVAARDDMYGGDAGGGQMVAIGGTYGMPKPTAPAANGGLGASGNHGAQTFLPRYQPTNSPIYPAELASPAAPYNSHTPSTMPQQAAMTHQHRDHQQHQQNRGPPQELDGTY